MDLRQLRYFIAVAKELHFSRATARLLISQPALSFDIKESKEQLGTQLLLRNNKSVKLTDVDQVLLVEARNLLLQAERVKRSTRLSTEGDVNQLRVGFVNSMLYHGLPRAMPRFEREHPSVEVVLGGMNSAEQAQTLQRGRINLGLVHWGRLPAEIVSRPLINNPSLCCPPAGHCLAGQARLDLAKLRSEDFIPFPRHVSPHYHDLIVARYVDTGFGPRIRHEARLWQTATAMVGLNMGVALIPETLCLAWRNEVRYLKIEPAGARSEIHAILPTSEPSRAARAFLATLKNGLGDA